MMECSGSRWTIDFPVLDNVNPEFRPISMNLKRNRDKLDHARAKFPSEVGDMIEPSLDDGHFSNAIRARVKFNDDVVSALMLTPDLISLEQRYTHIELRDLQESLDSGTVDREWDTIEVKEAYETAFEQRTNSVLDNIRFTIPEHMSGIIATEDEYEGRGWRPASTEDGTANARTWTYQDHQIPQEELSQVTLVVKGNSAVNFDKITPGEAIWQLNSKLGLTSWVDIHGTLVVGVPEANAVPHIAAPDDDRVWRYNPEEVNIRKPRNPIKQVTVEGNLVDSSGVGGPDDIISFFSPWSDDGVGNAGDVRAVGVAYRTDIKDGDTLSFKNRDVKSDSLEDVAMQKLWAEIKNSRSGTVEIRTQLSSDLTPLHGVKPGDIIQLVPEDDIFDGPITNTTGEIGDDPENLRDCERKIDNEPYIIKQVQQNVDDNGFWSLTLDLTFYPIDLLGGDSIVDSKTRYRNPRTGEYKVETDIFDGDWFEDF